MTVDLLTCDENCNSGQACGSYAAWSVAPMAVDPTEYFL
jgi:hypothetical protein